MCYPCGTVDKTVNDCPMCKVFHHSRCPHKKDICRNRNAHPHFDVMFLKNAEVESFNGCGFCKVLFFLPRRISLLMVTSGQSSFHRRCRRTVVGQDAAEHRRSQSTSTSPSPIGRQSVLSTIYPSHPMSRLLSIGMPFPT